MRKIEYLILILIAAVSFNVLSIGINKPFIGHHDWNNNYFSQIARNYIKYGPVNLQFGQLIGNSLPDSRNFYTHHPQLFPLILAAGIKIFGDTNWAVRLMPILFSVGTVIFLYLLLRKFFSIPSALLSICFMLVTPMFLYFGKMADHEAFTLFFIVFSLFSFVTWRQTKRKIYFYITVFGVILAQWAGWPGYYLAGTFFIWSLNPVFLIISIIDFALFLLNIYLLTGSAAGGGLIQILLFRMGLTNHITGVQEIYTNQQFLRQELEWTYHFFTPPQVLLTVLAIIVNVKNRVSESNMVWITFGLIAIVHVLLFRTGAWRHDYWLYYFLPFFAWGIGSGINYFELKVSSNRRWFVYAVYAIWLIAAFKMSQPFFWALQTMVDKASFL